MNGFKRKKDNKKTVINRKANNMLLVDLKEVDKRLLYNKNDRMNAKAIQPRIQNNDHSVVIPFIKSAFLHKHSTLDPKYKMTYQMLKIM